MCRRIGQRIDNLHLFDDRARPSMRDNQRQRIFMFRTNVNEMNVQPVDIRDELRQSVQSSFDLAPIVICRPIAREFLQSSLALPNWRLPLLKYGPLTVPLSGHLVAFMRLRNSVSSASGTFTLNGRISELPLVGATVAPVALVVFVVVAPVALVVFVACSLTPSLLTLL